MAKPEGQGNGESPVNASLRRDRMLAVIRERDFRRVGELSERFGLSEVTVRSDLDALAGRGEVHRTRGGAIPRTLPDKERPFEESETSFAEEKVALGRAAGQLVRDGEALLMGVGTADASASPARPSRARERARVRQRAEDRAGARARVPAHHRRAAGRDAAPAAALAGRA